MPVVFPAEDQRLTLAFALSVLAHLLLVFAGPGAGLPPQRSPSNRLQASILHAETPDTAAIPPAAVVVREDDPPAEPTPSPSGPPETEAPATEKTATTASNRPLSLPGAAAPYIEASALDQRPQFATPIPDSVPYSLSATSGTIRFVIYVSESGTIDRIEAEAPSGLQYAARYLEQLIRASEILPGSNQGVPARTRWTLEFTIEAANGGPATSAPGSAAQ